MSYMGPGNFSHNTTDIVPVNTEAGGDISPAHPSGDKTANFYDILLGQLDVMGALAEQVIAAATPLPVVRVVGMRSKLEVCWIATKGPITLVSDYQTVWYFLLVGEFPRKAVREVSLVSEAHAAIPITKCSASPVPTLAGGADVDFSPKIVLLVGESTFLVVVVNKLNWLSLHPPVLLGVAARDASLAAAAAVTSTIRNFVVIWSILSHVESPCRLGRSRSVRGAAGIFYGFNYSTGVTQ